MVGRLLPNMTVTEPHLGQYYARYASRTHGLPLPVPLHVFPRGRDFYKAIGEPRRIVAPMVDQSDLVDISRKYINCRHGESFLDGTVRTCVLRP